MPIDGKSMDVFRDKFDFYQKICWLSDNSGDYWGLVSRCDAMKSIHVAP